MKESPFGFEYSWNDLRPIRPLTVIVLVAQAVGSLLGLWFAKYPGWLENLWFGGALATFPGFLIGIPVQKWLRPNSLSENRVMVRRMALVALLLSVIAAFVPPVNGAR
jgi:MFS family permease